MSVAELYEGWPRIQARLVRRLPAMSPETLALKSSPDGWPIWAILSHLAGTRVYWLCEVFKEPGREMTPFADTGDQGWEDQLDKPRTAEELLPAIESTWQIVLSCLERWTPEMLSETFSRDFFGSQQRHTRQSVLTRLVMHDAFHTGEISLLLGMNGLLSLDPWEPIT